MTKVMPFEDLVARCEQLRSSGSKLVLTNGCFDLLHVGHVRYLRKARELGDALIVALNSDASVSALKGPGRPLVPEAHRAEVLAALESVDFVTLFDGETAIEVVSRVRPDVYVKGGDYEGRALPEAETVAQYGGLVVFLGTEAGTSTSGVIATVLERARLARAVALHA